MTDVAKKTSPESEVEKSQAGKMEDPGPESKTPPEAKKGSGSESSSSVPGPREEPKKPRKMRQGIEGAKRLVCRRCAHFLAELKAPEFEVLILCHRCKTENTFAYQGLG